MLEIKKPAKKDFLFSFQFLSDFVGFPHLVLNSLA